MGLRRLNMLKVGNRAPSHCTPLAVVSAALIPEKGSACFVMGLKHKLSKSMTSNRCNPSQAWPAAAASRSQWGMPARGWGGKFLDGIYYILGIYYIHLSRWWYIVLVVIFYETKSGSIAWVNFTIPKRPNTTVWVWATTGCTRCIHGIFAHRAMLLHRLTRLMDIYKSWHFNHGPR